MLDCIGHGVHRLSTPTCLIVVWYDIGGLFLLFHAVGDGSWGSSLEEERGVRVNSSNGWPFMGLHSVYAIKPRIEIRSAHQDLVSAAWLGGVLWFFDKIRSQYCRKSSKTHEGVV